MPKISAKSKRKRKLSDLLETIKQKQNTLQSKKVFAGFDGFVDTIVKIVKTKRKNKSPEFFRSKREFAKYILEKGESSFGLELGEESTRIGGNMPIFSNALGGFGVQVNCVGTLGYPQIHPVFKHLSANCKLYSFGNAGISTAYEFNDGKMLIAQMGELNTLGWNDLVSIIGVNELTSASQYTDLLCLLNWSEIEKATEIWLGLLNEVVAIENKSDQNRYAFFDLADCSRKSKDSIREMLDLVNQYGKYRKVFLGLNRNESSGVAAALLKGKRTSEFHKQAEKIFESMNIEGLVLHSSKEAILISNNGFFSADSFYNKHPLVSTGAGDHFNAGFCTGLMLEAEPSTCVALAHCVSGCFVESGMSPGWKELIPFLENKIK
jgi:hypothetical protein